MKRPVNKMNIPKVYSDIKLSIETRFKIACEKASANCDDACDFCLFEYCGNTKEQIEAFKEWELKNQ